MRAGSGADKLALEARNEALGAELEMVALCRPALERSTVDLADEVDDHDIALGGATRLLDRLAVLLLRRHALERFVDGLVVDAGDGALALEGPEVHRADLRHHLERHTVLAILALVVGGAIDLRLQGGPQAPTGE